MRPWTLLAMLNFSTDRQNGISMSLLLLVVEKITYLLLHIYQVFRQDHFFQWFEEIPWMSAYLDCPLTNGLPWKLLQDLHQFPYLLTDLLKRENWAITHWSFRQNYQVCFWSPITPLFKCSILYVVFYIFLSIFNQTIVRK